LWDHFAFELEASLRLSFARLLLAVALLVSTVAKVQATADGVWSRLVPDAVALPEIEAMSSAYDPVRGRMLTFGGYDGRALVGNLYALELGEEPRWSEPALGVPRPDARYGNSFVYDSLRDRFLLFGGNARGDENVPLGDTWVLSPGPAMSFAQLTTAGTAPARYGHNAVYDPVRDRMLVLFGYDGGFRADVWQLTLGGTPTWSQVATIGTPPSARDFAAAVYDPLADRVVVVGGNALPGPVARADAWSLSLAGTPTWTQLSPSGSDPVPRFSAASFYDPVRQRLVILGGTTGSNSLGDIVTLTLSGSPAWQTLSPSAVSRTPAGRWAAAFAYDAMHDRAVWVAGLTGGSRFLNDTWFLSLSGSPQWSAPPTANSPVPRDLSGAVYDPVRDQFLLFAGQNHNLPLDDLWALPMATGASWTPLDYNLTSRPDARVGPSIVLDSSRDRLVLFGGSMTSRDVWTFDLAARQWSVLPVVGAPPPARIMAGAMYDPAGDRMIVFQGFDLPNTTTRNDTWELDFQPQPHWNQILAPNAPTPRYACVVVHDSENHRMVVFGGETNTNTPLNDTWTLSLGGVPVWTKLTPGGSLPPFVAAPAAVFDPVRGRLVSYSGLTGPYHTDTYTLDLVSPAPAWSLAPAGAINPGFRFSSATAYDSKRDRMVMFGGRAPIKPGSLDFDSDASTWAYTWGEIPTPALLSLVDEQVSAGRVRLTWFAPGGAGQPGLAQRSTDDVVWTDVASLIANASGEFVLEDEVSAGGTWAYRLAVGNQFTDAHWVTVPPGIAFGIMSTGSNPSRGGLPITFALGAAGDAALDLYTVTGRRILHRDCSGLGVGTHSVDLAQGDVLPSGLYVLQLTQGAQRTMRKIVVSR